MGRMDGIPENHRFVVGKLVQQRVIGLDKARLLRQSELAGNRFGFAMFHAQTVQQSDQARSALIGNAIFPLNPRTDLAGRSMAAFRRSRVSVCLAAPRVNRQLPPSWLKLTSPLNPVFPDTNQTTSCGPLSSSRATAPGRRLEQLIPSSSSTNALARRPSRCAVEPSRRPARSGHGGILCQGTGGGSCGRPESPPELRLARGFSGFPERSGVYHRRGGGIAAAPRRAVYLQQLFRPHSGARSVG